MKDRELDQLLGAANFPPLTARRVNAIESAVVADLKPVRPLAPAGKYAAAFLCILVGACILGCLLVGQHGWSALSSLQRTLIFVPLAAVAALLVYSVVHQMTPAAKYPRSTAMLASAFFLWLLVIMQMIFRPIAEPAFVEHGFACFRTGMAFALPSGLLFALLLRRGAGLTPLLTGATAGGLAGLTGLTVLEIHCPNLNLYHIVVWHVAVTVVCLFLGCVFSSVTLLRWRSNP
jgi:hypothetical protein